MDLWLRDVTARSAARLTGPHSASRERAAGLAGTAPALSFTIPLNPFSLSQIQACCTLQPDRTEHHEN